MEVTSTSIISVMFHWLEVSHRSYHTQEKGVGGIGGRIMNGYPRSLPIVVRNNKLLHPQTRLTNFINMIF